MDFGSVRLTFFSLSRYNICRMNAVGALASHRQCLAKNGYISYRIIMMVHGAPLNRGYHMKKRYLCNII